MMSPQDLEQSGTQDKFNMEEVYIKCEPMPHNEDRPHLENGLLKGHNKNKDFNATAQSFKKEDIVEITVKVEPLIKEEYTSDQECSELIDDTETCFQEKQNHSLPTASMNELVNNMDPLKSRLHDYDTEMITSDLGTPVCDSVNSGKKPVNDERKCSYKCITCLKQFRLIHTLKTHNCTAKGDNIYKCTSCSKAFNRFGNLQAHIRTHTGDKPYKCTICEKSFTKSSNLNVHIRSHTGDKPYKCNTCSKCFVTLSHLSIHNRIHTGSKPYKCKTCDKAFITSTCLNVHMRTHTGYKPYKCETCKKGFTTSSRLSVHVRTHTGIKPYTCKTCNKTFSQLGNLNDHIRTHTGEKPYKCDLCDKSFRCISKLNRHSRVHDKDRHRKKYTKRQVPSTVSGK